MGFRTNIRRVNKYSIHLVNTIKDGKKAKIGNRYSKVPHLTQDTVWESDKSTRKHHIQESQGVSTFQGGDRKAACHRQDNIAKTNSK